MHEAVKKFLDQAHEEHIEGTLPDPSVDLTAAVCKRFWAHQNQIQGRVDQTTTRHDDAASVTAAGSQ